MPPAARSRTYARNGPLQRARLASSPRPAAASSSSSPAQTPATTAALSPPPSKSLEASSSLPVPPPSSPSPETAAILCPSVALGANPPAAARGKGRAPPFEDASPKRRRPMPSGPAVAVQGTLKGFFTAIPKPARPTAVGQASSPAAVRPSKRSRPTGGSSGRSSPSPSESPLAVNSSSSSRSTTSSSTALQQLLLAPLPSTLITCPTCSMTYARTSAPDLAAHTIFHRSVERGISWFRLGEVGSADGVEDVPGAEIEWAGNSAGGRKERGKGRVVRVRGIPSGKVGKKIKEVHALLNAHLSAPELPPGVLGQTQTFLLLSSSAPPVPRPSSSRRAMPSTASGSRSNGNNSSTSGTGPAEREFVIGACVVQRIESALRVLKAEEVQRRGAAAASDGGGSKPEGLVCVEPATGALAPAAAVEGDNDDDGGVFCDPTPLPTLLGVHRIHTSSLFRRRSLGSSLLSAACNNAIFGVRVTAGEGGVAFSQPTRSGRRLMRSWVKTTGGGGEVRVFVEDAA